MKLTYSKPDSLPTPPTCIFFSLHFSSPVLDLHCSPLDADEGQTCLIPWSSQLHMQHGMADSRCLPLLKYQNNSDHRSFPHVWRQVHHWFWWQILFENQCSSLPSCNRSLLSLLLTKENEICKAVGCVAFLWWTLYTGFKLFCLGYREICQPRETGPHLIACNEIHPPETLLCAVAVCWCPQKSFS